VEKTTIMGSLMIFTPYQILFVCSSQKEREGRGMLRVWGKGEPWRIILRRIFRKWDGGRGLDRAGKGQGQVAGTYKRDNEPSGSIKSEEFLD
jgi:hypothetical protein